MSSYDVQAVRQQFPALVGGAAHFDGPGGSQTPAPVAQAIYDTLVSPMSNRGVNTVSERNAEAAVQACRAAMADLLGADAGGIIFGRSMTALTMDMARTLAASWKPGDEVVVTRLDHDSNIRPWIIAAERVGAAVRFAEFDTATGELDPAAIGALLSERTKLVAVTAASNLIGTMPDIAAISRLVHDAGALLYVDGVHYTAHVPVDVAALGADFYGCSPYKFLGPHCGVLAAAPSLLETLAPDKLKPSTNQVPERFELGTLPYELMAGTTAAVDFLAAAANPPADLPRRERIVASMTAIEHYEDTLRAALEAELLALPGVTLYSRAARRTPTLLVTFERHESAAIASFLAEQAIAAPAGNFYALEASHALGLGDAGGLRIGLAPYTDQSDIDRLITALRGYLGAN